MPYDDRQLDDLLDRGLREYSQAEPRAGLEDRILANLRTQPEPRRWWRIWVPVLAAAAVLAIVAALLLRPSRPQPAVATHSPSQPRPAATLPPQPAATAKAAPRHAAHMPRVVAVKREPAPLPRQQTFPAPTPLTEQERLVLALLRHAPDEAIQVAQAQEAQRIRTDSFLRTGELPEAPGPDTRNPQ